MGYRILIRPASHRQDNICIVKLLCLLCRNDCYLFAIIPVRSHKLIYLCNHMLSGTVHDNHVSLWRIVLVLHTGACNLNIVCKFVQNRIINFNLAEDTLEHFNRNSARAKYPRNISCKSDYRAFKTYLTCTAVKNSVDFAVHIVHNMLCGCRTG